MHINWTIVIGFVVGFVFSFVHVAGVRAAIKEGGLPWYKAVFHVLFFLLIYPVAFFVGWLWWFICYGFTDGFKSANR